MPSGWHLSRVEDSSAAVLQPLLDLDEVESDIFSELEIGDRVDCVLPGSVVDKRDRDSEQVSELRGSEKVVQLGVLLAGWDGTSGLSGRYGLESVLKLCSGEGSRLSNQWLGCACWVSSPKFCLY
jgi:hypothetical protein